MLHNLGACEMIAFGGLSDEWSWLLLRRIGGAGTVLPRAHAHNSNANIREAVTTGR